MDGTKDERTKEEKYQRKLANLKLLKAYSDCSPEELEEQKAIREHAKAKCKEYHENKKTMNELAKSLLQSNISREQAEKILGKDHELIKSDAELTVAQVLNAKMVQEAVTGNVRAYEAIRDTAGFSPKQEIKADIDVMSDADRALIANIQKRIG